MKYSPHFLLYILLIKNTVEILYQQEQTVKLYQQ